MVVLARIVLHQSPPLRKDLSLDPTLFDLLATMVKNSEYSTRFKDPLEEN